MGKTKEGPTSSGYICNGSPKCKYLDSWCNGGFSAFAECKKKVWDRIKEWDVGHGCKTPESCPFIDSKSKA